MNSFALLLLLGWNSMNPELRYSSFYINGVKVVPPDIGSRLTARGLCQLR